MGGHTKGSHPKAPSNLKPVYCTVSSSFIKAGSKVNKTGSGVVHQCPTEFLIRDQGSDPGSWVGFSGIMMVRVKKRQSRVESGLR